MTMSTRAKSEAQLRHIDIKVRDMCEDLDPELIIEYPGSAPSMNSELWDIRNVFDKYENDLRTFLLVFSSELTEEEVTLWQHGLQSTQEVVKDHKLAVEDAVKQVMPPSLPCKYPSQ